MTPRDALDVTPLTLSDPDLPESLVIQHVRVMPGQPVHVLQLSDAHLKADADGEFLGVKPFAQLMQLVQDARQHAIDCAISTGDLAQEPGEAAYQLYQQAVAQLNTPHFALRGNHDAEDCFVQPVDRKMPTVVQVGQWFLILLNSQQPKRIDGEIGSDQLQALDAVLQYLSAHYPDHFVLTALHHHLMPVGSAWLDPHILADTDALLALLVQYPQVRLVVHGHVHQLSSQQHGQLDILSAPSTWLQFEPHSQRFKLHEQPPGYRLFTLYPDGRYQTTIHRLSDWSLPHVDHVCGY